MRSSDREEIDEVFAALDAAVNRACALSFDSVTNPERLNLLARLETVARRLPIPGHQLINRLDEQATPVELGGSLPHAVAERLHLTRGEASRRINEARDLGPRRTLTGKPLAPRLPATAAAQHAGTIGAPRSGSSAASSTTYPAGSMPPPETAPNATWPATPKRFVPKP